MGDTIIREVRDLFSIIFPNLSDIQIIGSKRRLDLLPVNLPYKQSKPSLMCCFDIRPFSRFGIFPVGGRSTAIRLRSGGVWVLASTPLDTDTKAKLDELGQVKLA
jgi:hypothetical protein